MKRIYLIDCPGVVPPNNNDSAEDILLRGVVRVENVENPEQYITAVLQKAKPHHIERTYDVKGFETSTEFLNLLARKGGRLLRGGEADVDGVAKMVLNDFLRGKIPWFTPCPVSEEHAEKGIEGRKGALGEMGKIGTTKENASLANGTGESHTTAETPDFAAEGGGVADDDEADEFEGFGENDDDDDEDEAMNSESDEGLSEDDDHDGVGLPCEGDEDMSLGDPNLEAELDRPSKATS